MLPNHEIIDDLAGRIEEAYAMRKPHWYRGSSTSRLWSSAALRLWEAHAANPGQVPLDAQLFVAAQTVRSQFSDPWLEIAHSESVLRYQSTVHRIVRQLQAELERESEPRSA